MSQDAITAVAAIAGRAPIAASEHYGGQADPIDMRTLNMRTPDTAQATPVASGGGASITVSSEPIDASAPAAMNLQSLAGQFSDGLQHGFYASDINHLMHTLQQSHQPDSGVSFGDVSAELLNVQAKIGVADAFSKISSKLADGLQTMVVRQG